MIKKNDIIESMVLLKIIHNSYENDRMENYENCVRCSSQGDIFL